MQSIPLTKAIAENKPRDETLTQITAKVPRWVQDEFKRVCRDTGLDDSKAIRLALIEIANILQKHWKRGPALPSFLENLEFHAEQYNIFFEPQRK